jgi:hypothetical protein
MKPAANHRILLHLHERESAREAAPATTPDQRGRGTYPPFALAGKRAGERVS